jgi:hypothetical protein
MSTTNRSRCESTAQPAVQSQAASLLAAGQYRFSLPAWLVAAVTPEQVCSALRCQVPEFASGQLAVRSCIVKRLRLHDGQGVWSGTILLEIEGLLPVAAPSQKEGNTQIQIVPLHAALIPPGRVEPPAMADDHPFGAVQWRCYLPELHLELRTQLPDSELAMLPQLTDPEQARSLLEASIRNSENGDYRDLRIQSCKPRVARYKPGSRCTVLYHLEYAPEATGSHHWPEVVVAKMYHGDKGQNAYTGMQALWRSPLGTSDTVRIAEPLAYLAELNVLVQGPIHEELTLKELLRSASAAAGRSPKDGEPEISPELASYVRKTAAGLAELHQCGVSYGENVTWEDELAKIYAQRAKVAKPLPHLATVAQDLLNHLQALAAVQPADPLAPAHRSFRPAQVLLSGGEIGFIDFDGFCQAEPALDLALFMTTVKNLGINKSNPDDEDEDESEPLDDERRLAWLTRAEAICELFLAEYEKHAPVSRTRILLWEALDLLSLVLGSWTKLKLARLDNCLFMLERHSLCRTYLTSF